MRAVNGGLDRTNWPSERRETPQSRQTIGYAKVSRGRGAGGEGCRPDRESGNLLGLIGRPLSYALCANPPSARPYPTAPRACYNASTRRRTMAKAQRSATMDAPRKATLDVSMQHPALR